MSAKLLGVAAARGRVLDRVAPLPSEPVPLELAAGRVTAADARSSEDVPGFDNSAMDGFAVRSADLTGASAQAPVSLAIAGESRAGAPSDRELAPGEAIAISTGGMLPVGADAVVRVEDTEAHDGTVAVRVVARPGANVRRAGEDIRDGDVVLAAGTVLGAAELGVLASIGVAAPECRRAPAVSVLCTGDELRGSDEALGPGEIRNSNALTLPALAREAGAEVTSVARVGDDPALTRERLASALAADVTVISGGVSVGEHDHVKDALADLGVERVFWGVALRPGKPTFFGVHEGGLVFGLPGNPVSAMVTFLLFARPALLAMQGADPERLRVIATLAAPLPRLASRDQAVRCRIEVAEQGWMAVPTGQQGSHVLTSMLGADGLAAVEAGDGELDAGSRVEVELVRAPAGTASTTP